MATTHRRIFYTASATLPSAGLTGGPTIKHSGMLSDTPEEALQVMQDMVAKWLAQPGADAMALFMDTTKVKYDVKDLWYDSPVRATHIP